MTKKNVFSVIAVAMLFAVSLYFVGGTYARYAGEYTGSATGQIASWAVKVNGDTSKTLNLTFTADDSTDVVEGKIAPGHSISSEVELDLNGTEVSVEALAEITETNLKSVFGDAADKVTVSTEMTKDGSKVEEVGKDNYTKIALPEGRQAFGDGDKVTVKITITWSHDGEEQNVNDTTVGEKTGEALQFTVPVTLNVRQYIAAA